MGHHIIWDIRKPILTIEQELELKEAQAAITRKYLAEKAAGKPSIWFPPVKVPKGH